MVLLDRSEVRMIPLNVHFKFKLQLKPLFFQNGVRPGALYPGFCLGGGFTAEQFMLWRYSIVLCGKENVSREFGGFPIHTRPPPQHT
jgi:hypothetical protein